MIPRTQERSEGLRPRANSITPKAERSSRFKDLGALNMKMTPRVRMNREGSSKRKPQFLRSTSSVLVKMA